ncbi:hypothetical protein [Microbacterium dextranolyticum]|uniref:Uncharacterized protein n=1 Tax=Microbacterium dextranolyticum TaxID=36806 RepID=A0A9W6HL61_9MICO|nr:hypothetical protein [Microbacterium dextranolyticum]MBM7462185.1 hypothetical protein [Microbacterium dextranolyticum]GLJ94434.1 hypothetical protein GCM10017591_04950 [Microbacterium dextranolyticum]
MSTRRVSATLARITRCAASAARHVERDLNDRVAEANLRLQTIPSSTGIDSSSVIHILDKRRYRVCDDVLRMPTRRPTREPFHPCPVAVLKDQEA